MGEEYKALSKLVKKLDDIPIESWKVKEYVAGPDYSTELNGKQITLSSSHYESKYSFSSRIEIKIKDGKEEIYSLGTSIDKENRDNKYYDLLHNLKENIRRKYIPIEAKRIEEERIRKQKEIDKDEEPRAKILNSLLE